jgi:cytosine/uracil/thiamine/allantoin permease
VNPDLTAKQRRMLATSPLFSDDLAPTPAGRRTWRWWNFTGGWSILGLGALALAILPSLPGFLVTIKVLKNEDVAPIFMTVYNYAWFVGFAVAFTAYLAGRKLAAAATAATPKPASLTGI